MKGKPPFLFLHVCGSAAAGAGCGAPARLSTAVGYAELWLDPCSEDLLGVLRPASAAGRRPVDPRLRCAVPWPPASGLRGSRCEGVCPQLWEFAEHRLQERETLGDAFEGAGALLLSAPPIRRGR